LSNFGITFSFLAPLLNILKGVGHFDPPPVFPISKKPSGNRVKTTVAEYEDISDSIGGEGCIIIYDFPTISVMVIEKDYNTNGRR
jgi:hypothetical protein